MSKVYRFQNKTGRPAPFAQHDVFLSQLCVNLMSFQSLQEAIDLVEKKYNETHDWDDEQEVRHLKESFKSKAAEEVMKKSPEAPRPSDSPS